MRWSQLHIPTLREDPADADAASHRLLLRAGFIRQLMAGHYSMLPLGMRVRAKIIDIIREEMNAIGAQEFLLPCMHPAEIWERSGRLGYGRRHVPAEGPQGRGHGARRSPTRRSSRPLATELASYRELPQFWYHFQTKFRDEAAAEERPAPGPRIHHEGLLQLRPGRGGLDKSFDAHRAAYERIFARLGIPALAAEASNGTMGGKDSLEFMCPSDAGEDLVATCPNCDYAANLERATSALADIEDEPGPAEPARLDTPGVRTIEDLATQYGLAADRQIKTLVQVHRRRAHACATARRPSARRIRS